MTFNDIFKTNFLEKVSSFSLIDAAIALALAFVLGLFIFIVYKKTYSGVMYSQNFGVSLIAMSIITTFVILAVTSNVVLSLGMVGALSIVRFRTAVKEPMDISFLFWAIAVGIVLGAGLIPLAVIGSLIIGIILAIFSNVKYKEVPYILVLSFKDEEKEGKIKNIINNSTKKSLEKAKTINKSNIELTYEVRLKKGDSSVINKLYDVDSVLNATLVSYNGEYMS